MTVNDKQHDKNITETASNAPWGARFKAAREALHFSEKDAANRLHLKPHLITIIETEHFENGPPAIFMRGYIRSYARLLNLPEKEVTQALAHFDLANPATQTPSAPLRTHFHAPTTQRHVGWSTSVVVVVLVGLVGMWWSSHSRHSKEIIDNSTLQTAQQTAQSYETTAQVPADPMPKELLVQPTFANTTPAAITPVTAASITAVDPASIATPMDTATTASATDTTPSVTTDSSTPAATTDTETKSSKHKTRIAKTKTPELTSDDMAVPEQGLESEEN